jgi:hypothetical protein
MQSRLPHLPAVVLLYPQELVKVDRNKPLLLHAQLQQDLRYLQVQVLLNRLLLRVLYLVFLFHRTLVLSLLPQVSLD